MAATQLRRTAETGRELDVCLDHTASTMGRFIGWSMPGARCGHQAAFARLPRSGDTLADHDGDVACMLIKLRG